MLGTVLEIPLNKIRPFSGQPRKYFSPDSLRKLAKSIQKRGQETPGSVRLLELQESTFGHEYELVDGERRFRACILVGVQFYRAIVINVLSKPEQFEKSVVSNFGSEPHTSIEIANAIKQLREQYTLEEITERLGKSMAWVCMYQSLLNLDQRVQAMLDPSLPEDKRIKLTTATLITRIEDKDLQFQAAQHIVNKKMTSRSAGIYILRLGKENDVKVIRSDAHDECVLVERFIHRLAEDSESILNVRQIDFKSALGRRNFHQLKNLMEKLEVCISNVTDVHNAIKAVYECRDRNSLQVIRQRGA